MATPLTITHVDQLVQVHHPSLPDIFVHNAECIFNSEHEKITEIIDPKTPSVLNKIRAALLKRFAELVPKFSPDLANKVAVDTKNKHTFVQDIILLGCSIVAKAPVENIDLVYINVPEETADYDLSELQPGLKNVIDKLLQNAETNKREILSLKSETLSLKTEVAILKARLGDPIEPIEPCISQIDNNDQPAIDILPIIEREPKLIEARPVKGAIKTTQAFIGGVLPPCSPFDIQSHIKKNTSVNPKISDIHKVEIRGEKLAFRVTVPKHKLHEVIADSVWDNHIIAEPYNPQKQKSRTPKGAKSNNKGSNRNHTFRYQNSHPRRPYRPNRSNYYSNEWSVPPQYQSYSSQSYRDQYEPQYWHRV